MSETELLSPACLPNAPQPTPLEADGRHVFTPEEQQARHELVVLDQLSSDSREIPSYQLEIFEKTAALPPDEARAKVYEMRFSPSSYDREAYQEYIGAMRRIRSEQAEYVDSRMKEADEATDPVERRALYLEALSYSPDISKRVMKRINKDGWDDKIFSDKQIIDFAESPELFGQAISEAIVRNPGIILRSYEILEKVADKQTIRTAFDCIIDDPNSKHELVNRMPTLLRYYEPEERIDIVKRITSNDKFAAAIYIFDDELGELIGETIQYELAREIFDDEEILPIASSLSKGIEAGVWTLDEVEAKVLSVTSSDPRNYALMNISNVEGLSESVISTVRQAVIDELSTTDDLVGMSMDTRGLLTESDIRLILSTQIERNIDKAIGGLSTEIERYFSKEEITEIYINFLESSSDPAYHADLVIGCKALPEKMRADYVRELFEKDPASLYSIFRFSYRRDAVRDLIGEEDLKSMIQEVINVCSFEQVSTDLDEFGQYFDSQESLRQYVLKGMEDYSSLFIYKYLSDDSGSSMGTLFSSEELESMLDDTVDKIIANGDIFYQSYGFGSIAENFGDEKLREITDKVRNANPERSLSLFSKVSYLYSLEENDLYISRATESSQGNLEFIRQLNWIPSGTISHDLVKNIILNTSHEYFTELVFSGESIEKYLTAEEIQQFSRNLLSSNPAQALLYPDFFEKHSIDTGQDVVIDSAINNEAKMGIAGKYLTQTLRRIQKSDNESSKKRLLLEASSVYSSISRLEQLGLTEKFSQTRQRLDPAADQERSMIETFLVLNSLNSTDRIDQVQTFGELQSITTEAVVRGCGIDVTITDVEIKRFTEQLVTPNSVGLYLSQYSSSEEHVAVVRPMVESILNGKYEDWHFGETTAESLDIMKEKGLLPEGLSLEQLSKWKEETISGYHEAFSLEATTAVADIRAILRDNIAELPDGSVIEAGEAPGLVKQMGVEIGELGQRIGTLHKEINLLRSQPDQTFAKEQLNALNEELNENEEERKRLQIRQDVALLLSLDGEDVSAGTIIQNGKKGKPIVQIIQRLSKNLGQEREFVVDRIQTVFDSYRQQTGDVRDIDVVDTINPRITIEIGEAPVSSCQNYRDGMFNEALLGYTDPNTKILLLRSDSGRPIARAIFRLLQTEDGSPALHVETIYSAEASDAVNRSMYKHAMEKAESMGIPLYVSSFSQDENGEMVAVEDPGSSLIRKPAEGVSLRSRGSRAPVVYVDSAGGPQKFGVYEIDKLSQLTPS